MDEKYSYISQLQSEIQAINHAEHVYMKESTHYQVKKASQHDQTLQKLMNTVLTGWPEIKHDTPISIHSYWNYHDEIIAQDGILYRGSRVIILQSMRSSRRCMKVTKEQRHASVKPKMCCSGRG